MTIVQYLRTDYWFYNFHNHSMKHLKSLGFKFLKFLDHCDMFF